MLTRSLTKRRSRVAIAILAVAIGAATMFALATIAIDIPRHLSLDMRSVGANLLISPAETTALPANSITEVTAALPDGSVVNKAGFRFETVRVNQQPFLAAGTTLSDAANVKGYWDVTGAWPTHVGEVLLGEEAAEWLGLRVADMFVISAITTTTSTVPENDVLPAERSAQLRVSGIFSAGGNEDALIVMSLSDLAQLSDNTELLHLVEFSVALDATALANATAIVNAQVPGVHAAVVQRLARSEADVLAMLRSLLLVIACIVLALTMIGVSTTMTSVVSERRAEIGLRKALGASDNAITAEFVGEAVVLGALGGITGVASGFGIAQLVSQQVFARPVGFTAWLALLSVAVALLVTWGAGLPPIKRAATIDPAIVLRED
jgi:putative ABC transport system permease protein